MKSTATVTHMNKLIKLLQGMDIEVGGNNTHLLDQVHMRWVDKGLDSQVFDAAVNMSVAGRLVIFNRNDQRIETLRRAT